MNISHKPMILCLYSPYSVAHSRLQGRVDAVVEGSVLHSGERVRIAAQLIEVPADKQIWAESYEGDFRDTLALQSRVACSVAERIRATLNRQEQVALAKSKTVNPAAYEYLRTRITLRWRWYAKRRPRPFRLNLNAMPRPFREILVLREIEELSYHQISEVTALPIGTVMSRLARARRAFGDAWRRETENGG